MGLIKKHEVRIWIAASVTMIAVLAIMATSTPWNASSNPVKLENAMAIEGVEMTVAGAVNRTTSGYEVPVNITNHRDKAIDIKAMDVVVTLTNITKMNATSVGPDYVGPNRTEAFTIIITTTDNIEIFVIDLIDGDQYIRCIMPDMISVTPPDVPQVPTDPDNNNTDPTPANSAPTAVFTVTPTSGNTATNFAFNATASVDNETAIGALQVRWDWDGNGMYDTAWSANKTATHRYTTNGTYVVAVQVRDEGNLTDIETKSVVVSAVNTAPTASFIASPSSGTTLTTFNFNATASTDAETPTSLQYQWNYGDGTATTSWSTTKIVQHQYANTGTFAVTLTVRDASLATATTTRSVTVTVADVTPPTVTTSPPSGATDVAVTSNVVLTFSEAMNTASVNTAFHLYQGSTSIPGAVTWSAGNTIMTFNPTSDLDYSQNYQISVGAGAQDLANNGLAILSSTFTTEAAPNQAPTASFTATPNPAAVGETIAFDADGSDDDTTPKADLMVRWDFDNDGTWDTGWETTKATTHSYDSVGTYQVKLEVRDAGGLTGTMTQSIVIA